jgi:MFS family permease
VMCCLLFMQVPSNLICMRVGLARWLSGIMLCWGAVAALFAAVQHKWQFYVLRLLLGLAEAGSFPAV